MQRFELGVAYRGSGAPEMKRFIEASSMREAMLEITQHFGGHEVALVTYAHYCPAPEVQRPEQVAPSTLTSLLLA